MLELQIPKVGLEAPKVGDVYDQARSLLLGRAKLLDTTVHPLTAVMNRVIAKYNSPKNVDVKHQHEVKDGTTRNDYSTFLQSGVGQEILELWFGKGTTLHEIEKDPYKQEVYRSILYGLNKLKLVDRTSAMLVPRHRKAHDGGEGNIYQSHTHLEIPFILRSAGILSNQDLLTLSLGVNHDTAEEGIRVILDEGGKASVQEVDTHSLIAKFPDNQLGRKLTLGIQVLTEAEIEELQRFQPSLVADLLTSSIANGAITAENAVQQIMKATGQDRKRVVKNLVEDPLVFGGLALQIVEFAKRAKAGEIPHISQEEAIQLVQSIINVEFADRISDISDLTRLIMATSQTDVYKRQRVMMYTSRMLNMMEKLQEAASIIGSSRNMTSKFLLYKRVLEVELAEVNKVFGQRGIPPIVSEEMTQFHWNTARPIQFQADKLMEEFIVDKLDRISTSAA